MGEGKIEFVVVDDGSTDLTAKICAGYAINNSIIKFIQLPHNVGTNAARNTAFSVAKGDYIVMLDSDDYLVDDALKFMESTIEGNSGYTH